MPLFNGLGQGGPLGAIGNNRPARWNALGVFDPSSLFGPSDDGFLFNFSKTDRLFQDTAGTTPAVADTAPIALALEGHAWAGKTLPQLIAGQPELSANPGGPFTATTGWTNVGGSHSVSGGNLNITRGAGTTYDTQQQTHASGAMLLNQFNVIALPGTGSLRVGSVAGNNEDANQGFSGTGLKAFFVKTAGANRYVSLLPSSTAGDVLSISNFSCKAIPGNHGSQTTTSARPFWKTPNFARFDGADDNWLTTFNPPLAASLAVKLNANAIGKIVVGAESGTNGRSFIGINSSGKFSGGIGAQSFATIQGTTTITNTLGVGVMTYDGTTVKLYWNGALEYSAAQSGVPGSSSPYRVGAFNSAGTAANFYSGDLYNALAINRALTPAEIINLTNSWGTT